MKPLCAGLIAATFGIAAAAPQAGAAVMTYMVSFTATSFYPTPGSDATAVPPYQSVSGSFTLSLDTAQNYHDATQGITLDSFNPADLAAGGVGFSYNSSTDQLLIGGVGDVQHADPVGTSQVGDPDFGINIANFTTAPFGYVGYTEAGYNGSATSTTPVFTVTPVPEPACLGAIAAVGGLGLSRRRRA